MDDKIKIMASACGYSYEEVVGRSRIVALALVRQLIWYRMRKSDTQGGSYATIGVLFGGRSHSCVLQGINHIKGLLYIGDKYVMEQYEKMEIAERMFEKQEEGKVYSVRG